jgi:hypothetical protein
VKPKHRQLAELGSMRDAWRVSLDFVRAHMDIDFLVEEVSLFGIRCQVWHFIYLATGAVAFIYAKITGQ